MIGDAQHSEIDSPSFTIPPRQLLSQRSLPSSQPQQPRVQPAIRAARAGSSASSSCQANPYGLGHDDGAMDGSTSGHDACASFEECFRDAGYVNCGNEVTHESGSSNMQCRYARECRYTAPMTDDDPRGLKVHIIYTKVKLGTSTRRCRRDADARSQAEHHNIQYCD